MFDITGREVQTPVNESLNSWTYATKLDAAQFASGIYFYKLSATSFTETKKMIL
ncbi:MAG: T9SS type A sorting domain-containing protein [Ignavibacteria bacterium]|nr:T9SS type A sorting domain-containing protein [Ignavibacteria bacterium]